MRNDIPDFTPHRVTLDGIEIAFEMAGTGAPLVLLHGFPQTRAMWADIAPTLAKTHTVVVPDLRGYGESAKPQGMTNYSFRAMAADVTALMTHLGHATFHAIGHDRGARTVHRMALDAPDRVQSLVLMDIVPTHHLLTDLSHQVARAYYHWFFLAQPAPFPENMIAADPQAYYESCLLGFGAAKLSDFKAIEAYRTAWRDADCRRAMCDDYRAAIDVDMELDAADLHRQLTCPALVLYGADGAMAKTYDIPATWADRLADLQAAPIGGGHFFVEQSPEETLIALSRFLQAAPSPT